MFKPIITSPRLIEYWARFSKLLTSVTFKVELNFRFFRLLTNPTRNSNIAAYILYCGSLYRLTPMVPFVDATGIETPHLDHPNFTRIGTITAVRYSRCMWSTPRGSQTVLGLRFLQGLDPTIYWLRWIFISMVRTWLALQHIKEIIELSKLFNWMPW